MRVIAEQQIALCCIACEKGACGRHGTYSGRGYIDDKVQKTYLRMTKGSWRKTCTYSGSIGGTYHVLIRESLQSRAIMGS